jgi:hypothetical protein
LVPSACHRQGNTPCPFRDYSGMKHPLALRMSGGWFQLMKPPWNCSASVTGQTPFANWWQPRSFRFIGRASATLRTFALLPSESAAYRCRIKAASVGDPPKKQSNETAMCPCCIRPAKVLQTACWRCSSNDMDFWQSHTPMISWSLR